MMLYMLILLAMCVSILARAVFRLYLMLMPTYLQWILPKLTFKESDELLKRYFTLGPDVTIRAGICVMIYVRSDEASFPSLSGTGA